MSELQFSILRSIRRDLAEYELALQCGEIEDAKKHLASAQAKLSELSE